MDDILERLRSDARERFGPDRLAELEPILQNLAHDLAELTQYPLEADDAP